MPVPESNRSSLRRETLHALVIDDVCGQLPREVSELLAAWLAVVPADGHEAQGIRDAVALAQIASRTLAPMPSAPRRQGLSARLSGAFALAASLAVLLAWWYRLPQHATTDAVQPQISWTRYDLTSDDRGGLSLHPRIDAVSTP